MAEASDDTIGGVHGAQGQGEGKALRPLRVITFPDRPEALLFVAAALPALPAMSGPFSCAEVRETLHVAGIEAHVHDEVPGRWIHALRRVQAGERSERAQRQKLRMATEMSLAVQSPDSIVRDRATLLRQKQEADESIAQMKAKIATAKNMASTRGIFMPRDEYQRLNERLDAAKLMSQGLQGQLGALRQREKERNAATWEQEQGQGKGKAARVKAFVAAARRMLSPEDFKAIWAEVDTEMAGGEEEDLVEDDVVVSGGRVMARAARSLPPPDWDVHRSCSAARGWKPEMVRFHPAPDGRKRRVQIEEYAFALHHHIDITPDRNPVWDPSDGGAWASYADDPLEKDKHGRTHHASFERKDRAMRWIRQILTEHFPAETWEAKWPEGWDPATLRKNAREEERVRSCPICNGPRSEHTPERLADCDRYIAEFKLAPPGTKPPTLPVALAGRNLPGRKAATPVPKAVAKPEQVVGTVLVDPGKGAITGTVGTTIIVLQNMHPDQVGLLAGAQALLVEQGGATVHLANVAREVGVGVMLREDATLRYKAGMTLTINFGDGEIVVHGKR